MGPLEDAFAASQIDEAMEDVAAALDPDDRVWLREQLARLLIDDPALREALAGARPHAPAQSGEQPIDGRAEDDAALR